MTDAIVEWHQKRAADVDEKGLEESNAVQLHANTTAGSEILEKVADRMTENTHKSTPPNKHYSCSRGQIQMKSARRNYL